MPRLYEKQSGQFLGTVSDADIQSLVDQLEEEHQTDEDYFVDSATIDLLEEAGASASLISMLRGAVGDSDGVDVRYEK
jgi:hypothetical protein